MDGEWLAAGGSGEVDAEASAGRNHRSEMGEVERERRGMSGERARPSAVGFEIRWAVGWGSDGYGWIDRPIARIISVLCACVCLSNNKNMTD